MNKTYYLLVIIIIFLTSENIYGGIRFTGGKLPKKVYILKRSQYPGELKKYQADNIYIKLTKFNADINNKKIINGDTILNFSLFKSKAGAEFLYRLVFDTEGTPDSAYHITTEFKVINKIFNKGNDRLSVNTYNTAGNITGSFNYNYKSYLALFSKPFYKLPIFFKLNDMWGDSFEPRSVWMLSIGINDYGHLIFKSSKNEATSYDSLFRSQARMIVNSDSAFHSYLLVNERATKENILKALIDIAARASKQDYFIFNFSGYNELITVDSTAKNGKIYLAPYDVILKNGELVYRNKKDTFPITKLMISLKSIQEHIQQIVANQQLIITESCNNVGFKTELIKTLMQNSPDIASILNKNRVIIVPNKTGYDSFNCNGKLIEKGGINYAITSLDSIYNIYEVFDKNKGARIANDIKNRLYNCNSSLDEDHFDVFFEKQFLKQYQELVDAEEPVTRGIKLRSGTLKKSSAFTGKKYALVIGTDIYKAEDWPRLVNPVYDATKIAEVLQTDYGYQVKLLKNAPMDSIYSNFQYLNRTLNPNDQLIVYIAGHGDFEQFLLDDGFIVCSDSKPVAADPMRNSYIQHSKLKKMLNKLPASQLLVILDICFGGTFDENILGNKARDNNNSFNIQNTNVINYLNEISQYKVRRMLSSAGKDPAYDGKVGQHSPFAAQLLMVLEAGGEGTNGIVTLSNIFTVLQQQSLNETARLRIKPYKAQFGDDIALGEFVLIPSVQKPEE